MKRLLLVVILGVGVLMAAPVVDGNVNPSEEGYILVEENSVNTDKAGADLLAFYYTIANDSLYLAITTQNTAAWDVAYGFSIDAAEGGYVGNPNQDTPRDSWGRRLHFPIWNPDYQVYFWFSGVDQAITSSNFNRYNGSGWDYNFAGYNWVASYGGPSGLQALEVALPLEAIGNPAQIKTVAYICGGDNSSAVDILPYDPSVSLSGGEEWTDWDTITVSFNANIREVSSFGMKPILNGVRLTGNGKYTLEVYSVDGKKVFEKPVDVVGQVDVRFNLKPGMYLVREPRLGASKFIVVK